MTDVQMTRRAFAVLAASGVLVSVFPGCAPEIGITEKEKQALVRVAQLLYPHEDLSDSVYGEVLLALRESTMVNDDLGEIIRTGLNELDRVAGSSWLTASKKVQVDALRQIENGPFFETIQDDIRPKLYQHSEVWKLIGYEGSSVEHGGYINRGFNDIDWLPED